jgi:hypothetical protein
MTIQKSTCEKYTIHLPKMEGWAIIFLSEADGSVSIISDYGNWGYRWPNHGCDSLKHFLCDLCKHYAWVKFTGSLKHYNHDETIKTITEYIQEMYEDDSITQFQAEGMTQELGWMENEHHIYNSDVLTEHISDIYELFHYDPDYQFMMFFDRLWSVFAKHLKSELDSD